MDRIIDFVDASPSLSPATMSTPRGLTSNSTVVARMETLHALSSTDFHSPRPVWQTASSRDQYWAPSMAPFPRVTSQLPVGRLITLDYFHHGREQCFVLTGIDAYSGYRCASPAYSASAKTTIHRLWECFIHCHGIPHGNVSDEGTHFTARRGAVSPRSRNSLVLPCPPLSWSNWLDSTVDGPLKAQFQCQLGDNTL